MENSPNENKGTFLDTASTAHTVNRSVDMWRVSRICGLFFLLLLSVNEIM